MPGSNSGDATPNEEVEEEQFDEEEQHDENKTGSRAIMLAEDQVDTRTMEGQYKSPKELEKEWQAGQREAMGAVLADSKQEYEERLQRNGGRNSTDSVDVGHAGTMTQAGKNRLAASQDPNANRPTTEQMARDKRDNRKNTSALYKKDNADWKARAEKGELNTKPVEGQHYLVPTKSAQNVGKTKTTAELVQNDHKGKRQAMSATLAAADEDWKARAEKGELATKPEVGHYATTTNSQTQRLEQKDLPYGETHTATEAFLHERGYHTRASMQQLGADGKEEWDQRADKGDLETKPEVGAYAKPTVAAKRKKEAARELARERRKPDANTKAGKQFAKRRAQEEAKKARLQAALDEQQAALDALAAEEDAAVAQEAADEAAKQQRRREKEEAALAALAAKEASGGGAASEAGGAAAVPVADQSGKSTPKKAELKAAEPAKTAEPKKAEPKKKGFFSKPSSPKKSSPKKKGKKGEPAKEEPAKEVMVKGLSGVQDIGVNNGPGAGTGF